MRSVGINTLKSKLTEYVRLAATGETVLITDDDHVVAELRPTRISHSSYESDDSLAHLIQSGILTPPTDPSSMPLPKPPPLARLEDVLRELDESREDR